MACDWCGKIYYRYRSERDAQYQKWFCGKKCLGEWKSVTHAGANSPHWKGGKIGYYGPNWLAQKRAARKRDKYRCCHCGKTQKQNGYALDVHHIQPFRSFGYVANQNDYYLQANDLTNLVSLCRSCHKRAEAGSIPIQPYLL